MDHPTALWKYMPLKGEGMDRFESMLGNNQIWFSSPKDFNDPFDCNPLLHLETEREIVLLRQAMYLVKSGMPLPEALAKADEVIPKQRRSVEEWWSERASKVNEAVGNSGILCLTPDYKNFQMWTHYANEHKGVCVCLEAIDERDEASIRFLGSALPVDYSTRLPSVSPVWDAPEETVKKRFLTKSGGFQYEQEWRIVKYNEGYGLKPLPRGIVTAIILGSGISPEHRECVRKACSQYDGKVEIVTAKLARDRYSLEFEKVEEAGRRAKDMSR